VAITLLVSGGLPALQTASIASALPFSLILLTAIWGLFKALHFDSTKRLLKQQSVVHYSRQQMKPGGWQRRLRSMMMFPRRAHVNRFIEDVVLPAFEEVAEEIRKQGYVAEVEVADDMRCKLEVQHNDEVNFVYKVEPEAYIRPDFMTPAETGDEDVEVEEREKRKYFRDVAHLLECGQDYDLMGWQRDEVIEDILDQYEQHMHFLHVIR